MSYIYRDFGLEDALRRGSTNKEGETKEDKKEKSMQDKLMKIKIKSLAAEEKEWTPFNR